MSDAALPLPDGPGSSAEVTAGATATQAVQQFYQLITVELELMQAFSHLLQDEQTVLGNVDTERLSTLADEKTRVAGRLNQLAGQRHQLLQQQLGASTRQAVDGWLQDQESAGIKNIPEIRQRWQALLDVAAEARAYNETNGRLINLHLQHNQHILNALLTAGNQTAALYGPDGQKQAPESLRLRSGRQLGEA